MKDTNGSATRIPIIRLWGQLIVAMQGDISDQMASNLCTDVLQRIQEFGSRGMVVDLSGLWIVDSHLCAIVAQLARSAKLMGTLTVLSGMSAEVAMTLQSMGVDFGEVRTALGLEEAMVELGVRVVRQHADADSNAFQQMATYLLEQTSQGKR